MRIRLLTTVAAAALALGVLASGALPVASRPPRA